MSFKEQLRDEILPKAVGYFNSGLGMNESVVKAAEDFNLNSDQVDRLVETMNTARTIAHYEKNAEDRTGSFEIADKDEVRRLIYSDKSEKTASSEPFAFHDYSSYDMPERDYRRKPVGGDLFEKAAAENAVDDSVKALSERQTVDELVKKASQLSEMARTIDDSVGMLQDGVETMLSKLASSLSRGYDPDVRYATFSVCSRDCPTVAKAVARRMPQYILKGAAYHEEAFRDMNVVDDTDVASELAMAREAEELVAKVAECKAKADDIRKSEAVARDRIRKIAAATPWGEKPGGDDEEKKKKDKPKSKGSGGLNGSPMDSAYVKSVYGYLSGDGIGNKELDEIFFPEPKVESGIQDYVDNVRRSAILDELASTDPILSEADPKDIVSAYKTLVQASPKMSLNKEIVRAVLRQSVNSVAVSPFDAKQWLDYENVAQKNTGIAQRAMGV